MAPPPALDITWLGHATTVIVLDGISFVTDPALTPRLAHLRRHHHVDAAALTVDVVLISHVHMDHLHVPSLRLLGEDVEIVVPRGAADFLRRRGFRRVRETSIGDRIDIGRVGLETVRAVHPSRRGPHSALVAPAVGYVLRGPEGSVYFAGDTDLFDEMAGIGGTDVALLPIAGWGPTLGAGHLDPSRAAQATGLVLPRLVVPIHWGTYSPIRLRRSVPGWVQAPAEEFADRLAAAGHRDRLRLLAPGEHLSVPTAPPSQLRT